LVEAEIVHDDIETVGGNFSKELKRQVVLRDQRVCQICGAELEAVGLDVHHVNPRQMGGSPSKNHPGNLITVCRTCHNKIEAGKLKITRWAPSDKDNGLCVQENRDGEYVDVPKEKLYFYQLPQQALVDEAHYLHKEAIQYIKQAFERAGQSIEIFVEIKQRKLYKHIPDENGNFYQSFRQYYNKEVVEKFADLPKGPLSLDSINSYVSSLTAIKGYVPESEERAKIPRGSMGDLASILRDDNIPEEEKQNVVELSKRLDDEKSEQETLKQSELRKLKRDLKVQYGSAQRVKICDDCMVPETIRDTKFRQKNRTYKIGNRGLHWCPVSEAFLEGQNAFSKEKIATNCPQYEEFD